MSTQSKHYHRRNLKHRDMIIIQLEMIINLKAQNSQISSRTNYGTTIATRLIIILIRKNSVAVYYSTIKCSEGS